MAAREGWERLVGESGSCRGARPAEAEAEAAVEDQGVKRSGDEEARRKGGGQQLEQG